MSGGEQKQEHTASWYAATANEVTDYPELRGQAEAEVCIVGAGFTGVAAALTLAERGHSVAVVEANRVGWGASGRNGGQLINGISGLAKVQKRHGPAVGDLLWDLRWRGNDIVRERVRKYDIRCDLKDGFVETAVKPRHMRELESTAAELERRDDQRQDALAAQATYADPFHADTGSGHDARLQAAVRAEPDDIA